MIRNITGIMETDIKAREVAVKTLRALANTATSMMSMGENDLSINAGREQAQYHMGRIEFFPSVGLEDLAKQTEDDLKFYREPPSQIAPPAIGGGPIDGVLAFRC